MPNRLYDFTSTVICSIYPKLDVLYHVLCTNARSPCLYVCIKNDQKKFKPKKKEKKEAHIYQNAPVYIMTEYTSHSFFNNKNNVRKVPDRDSSAH